MSLGEGFPPILGDPGYSNEANPFARSAKVSRSPGRCSNISNVASASDKQEDQVGLGLGLLFTPKNNSVKQQAVQTSKLVEVKKKVNELYEFIKDKHNVHHKIKEMVTSING